MNILIAVLLLLLLISILVTVGLPYLKFYRKWRGGTWYYVHEEYFMHEGGYGDTQTSGTHWIKELPKYAKSYKILKTEKY